MVAVPFTCNTTRRSLTLNLAGCSGCDTLDAAEQSTTACLASQPLSSLPCGRRIKPLSCCKGSNFAFIKFVPKTNDSYEESKPTMMRAACCSVLFWNTICNTPSIFRLADYLKDFKDSRTNLTRYVYLIICFEALGCKP